MWFQDNGSQVKAIGDFHARVMEHCREDQAIPWFEAEDEPLIRSKLAAKTSGVQRKKVGTLVTLANLNNSTIKIVHKLLYLKCKINAATV